MSTLGREELFEACRAIYKTAGDNFMLPPLIRDVESPEEHQKHTYYSLTDAECIRFIIELDEAYVGGNKFPLKKFPLRFRCELCDLDFQEPPIELGEIETRALIRAFFLGVKVQINASENRHTKKYNLRIQLSSTLFVECGELIDEDDELTPEAICNQVSLDLYSKSSDFFWNSARRNYGLARPRRPRAIWRAQTRARSLLASRGRNGAPRHDARRHFRHDASGRQRQPCPRDEPASRERPYSRGRPHESDQGEAGVFCFRDRRLTDNRRYRFDGGLRLLGCDLGAAEDANDQRANRFGGVLARKSSGLCRSSWPRLGSRRANAHNAGPFWRCKRSFRAASSGDSHGRRDASSDRRDEASASGGGRGDAGRAGGILRRRSQAGETKRNSSKEETRRGQNCFITHRPRRAVGSRR